MATIFTATLSSNDGGNDGFSFRDVCTITAGALGQVRCTFKCATGSTFGADHCAIGISTGSASNTTATPVELTFAGAHGFSLTSAQTITSDWVNLSGFTSSDKLIVIVDFSGTGGGANAFDGTSATPVYVSGSPTASYNAASPAGFSLISSTYALVASIETQAGGGGGGNTPYNPWPQLAPMVAQKHRMVGWSPNFDPRRRSRKPNRLILPQRALPVPERKLLIA